MFQSKVGFQSYYSFQLSFLGTKLVEIDVNKKYTNDVIKYEWKAEDEQKYP